jgi:hypothetical protein
MNNKIKSEKYRKLSVAALVTGIMTDVFAGPFLLFGFPGYLLFQYLMHLWKSYGSGDYL